MIQSFNNWMISDGCLNRDRLLSPRFGNQSTSLTSETARAAGLPSGRVSTALWPHPGLGAPAPETRTAEPSRGSGGAEAPGETVTTTNSLTSCPLRVGRAVAKLQNERSSEEERRVSPRRRCTKARAVEGEDVDAEKAQGADSNSRHFGTVSGCSSAGNSRSPKTTSHNGAAGPLHKLWRQQRRVPGGRARTFLLQSPGASLF